jgi:hypothetical protein
MRVGKKRAVFQFANELVARAAPQRHFGLCPRARPAKNEWSEVLAGAGWSRALRLECPR